MKNGLRLALVYIGLVIGAGFASGREILQYFNLPSLTDQSGIVIATFLFMAVCYVILYRSYTFGINSFNDYLGCITGKFSKLFSVIIYIYLFCGFFTMFAGSGALIEQSFMKPSILGIFLMAFICFVTLSFNLKGIVALNMILVPCMIMGILYISFASVFLEIETSAFSIQTKNIILSSILYVSYNTLSAPAVLVPLQKGLSPTGITTASVFGGFVLGMLIMVIWFAQSLNMDILLNSQIPMLHLAAILGKSQKQLYSVILFMSICTTAVSQGFGLMEYFNCKTAKTRVIFSALLCTAALPFSLIKFSALVEKLCGFFGLVGLLWMVMIFIDFYRKG